MQPTLDESGPADERELGILRVIEEEDLEGFSFEGLKRRISAHPETLSRALDRLQEQSFIERYEDGYRVTSRGRDRLAVHQADAAGNRLTILKTMLPPGVNQQLIFGSLKGRWFGNLRWLGYSEGGGDVVMKWVTDDGTVQLDARFARAELTVEGRLLRGKELARAVRAAHLLLAHISRAYGAPRLGRTLLFEVFPDYETPN